VVDTHNDTWRDILRRSGVVAIIGATVWALCSCMRWLCDYGLTKLLGPFEGGGNWSAATTLLLALAVGGTIRWLLERRPNWRRAAGDGVDHSMELFHLTLDRADDDPRPRTKKPGFTQAVRRVVMTVLTLGTGASGGLEGPAVMVGEAMGAEWSRQSRVRSAKELRLYQMAGMAAGVTTLLDAPFTGAIFAAEIAYRAAFQYRILAYGLLAGVVCYGLNNHVIGFAPLFQAPIVPHSYIYSPGEYLGIAGIAISISAPAALGMTRLFRVCERLFAAIPTPLRAPLGAVLTGVVALIAWFALDLEPRHALGMGERTISELLSGTGNPLLRCWWVLLLIVVLRTTTTALTLRSGGSVGTLVPAMIIGGVGGGAAYYALAEIGVSLGAQPTLAVVSGIAAGLTAVAHVPLASVAFVLEGFHTSFGPPAVLACAVCHITYARFRLYGRRRGTNQASG